MNKAVSQVLSIVLLASFLVSFTGVRLLVHECDTCGTVDFSLLGNKADGACCNSGTSNDGSCALPNTDTPDSGSCCSDKEPANTHSTSCCTNETVYIIADLDFIKDNSKPKIDAQLVATCIFLLSLQDFIIPDQPNHSSFYQDFSPPLRSGRDFVIFSHQLKIS
jgi:hypothetical protein